MGSLQNRFDLREKKKVTGAQIGGIWGCSKVVMFFQRETDEYSGLCEQESYRDGAPMRELSKSSSSCQALILRSAEESFYRRFGSLFGLGVGIRNVRCLVGSVRDIIFYFLFSSLLTQCVHDHDRG